MRAAPENGHEVGGGVPPHPLPHVAQPLGHRLQRALSHHLLTPRRPSASAAFEIAQMLYFLFKQGQSTRVQGPQTVSAVEQRGAHPEVLRARLADGPRRPALRTLSSLSSSRSMQAFSTCSV